MKNRVEWKILRSLYEGGTNISAYLRQRGADDRDIIELSYDLQAGSYISALGDPEYARYESLRTQEIARVILGLCRPATILEAGVGDGTTLAAVVQNMDVQYMRSYGFDLSWSRANAARNWCTRHHLYDATITTGDLQHIPFADDAIDLVYTYHAIEPNRGREVAILRELYRVAREYVVLLEPAYELGSAEARARMDAHGYCRGIAETARALGYDVIEHTLFKYSRPALNPTALTLIRKVSTLPMPAQVYACPRTLTPLVPGLEAWFSDEAKLAYPVLGGVPCLRPENAILAGKYQAR